MKNNGTRAGKFIYLPLIFVALAYVAPGCQKSKENPCKDILSETPPTQVGLIFLDGQTGENILLSKNIESGAIKITPDSPDLSETTGTIVKNTNNAFYGSFKFHIEDLKKGDFKYSISVPDIATTTLSYANTEEKSDNACRPYIINVHDPVIAEHQYTVTRSGTNIIIKITL